MLRLIKQGPGFKEFPVLMVGSSKEEVDSSSVKESLLHFSLGKELPKEVEKVRSKKKMRIKVMLKTYKVDGLKMTKGT